MAAYIDIVIKNGKVSIEVEGIEDASCADITRLLEEQLGIVDDVHQKPQYYQVLEEMEIHQHISEE